MKLKSISMEAFRSFKDKNTTPPLPAQGLCLIEGHNRDTGGSSGSGKSTVGLAVAHAFRFSPFAGTALQSWLTDKKLQVELELEGYEGEGIVLGVGREQFISVDGEVTKGSATAVQEKLQGLTGLTPDLMRALTYRPQKKPGLFLSMTDSDKKEFLSTLLGLEELEKAAEAATRRANSLERDIQAKEAVVESLQAQLAEFDLAAPEEPPEVAALQAKKELREAEVASCKERLAALAERISLVRQKITETRAGLEAVFAAERQSLEKSLDVEVEPFWSEWMEKAEDAKAEQDAAEALLAEEKAKEEQTKRNLWNEVSDLVQARAELDAQRSTLPRLEAELAKVEQEMAATSAAKCPTCSQAWADHKEHLEKLTSRRNELIANLTSVREAVEKLPVMDKYLATRRQEIESYVSEDRVAAEEALGRARKAAEEARNSLAADRAAYQAKASEASLRADKARLELSSDQTRRMAEAEAPLNEMLESLLGDERSSRQILSSLEGDVNKVTLDLLALQQQFESAKKSYELQLQMYEDVSKRLDAAKADAAAVKADAALEADFAALIGREGFLGSIFEEVLVEISAEANKYLAALPNVATTTVEFVTEAETKRGTVQRRITPVITKNGVEIPLEAGLSGGQLTSVELAVDLAVIEVVGRRTGRMPGWLILDESFEGHDLPVKEACLEILKAAAKDKLILIVDHATEVKEMFDFTIRVESSGDVSTIVT